MTKFLLRIIGKLANISYRKYGDDQVMTTMTIEYWYRPKGSTENMTKLFTIIYWGEFLAQKGDYVDVENVELSLGSYRGQLQETLSTNTMPRLQARA